MHDGLPCQTDETPDARELYVARVEACDDCAMLAATRGAPAAAPLDEEPIGEITWLVQAALTEDDGPDARRKPPMPAQDTRLNTGNSPPGAPGAARAGSA